MNQDPGVDSVELDHHRVVNHFFHDFHGDISTIIMCIGAVRDGTSGSVPIPQRQCLDRAIDNCEHMVGSYPRIAEQVDVAAELLRAQKLVDPSLNARAVALQIHAAPMPVVRMQAQLFGRVLSNLLLQVVDNTPSKGTVELEASIESGQVVIRVRFEGTELDAELATSVFDPVHQANVGLRLGRGYTLLFCKQAIAYLGGSIFLTPWRGRGNQFEVRVPFQATG
jgi:signal transduction histidine kinase